MDRVETGVGQQQRIGVGQTDVLRGEDHQPAGDEARFFASGQHPRQIVDGRVGIAAANRFDEGRDDVVVLFAVFVVEGDVLLEAVGNVAVGDRYLAVGCADHDVEDVEQLAGVAAREAEQGAGLVHLDLAGLQLGVGRKGPVEKRFEVRVLHRFEHIDLTAAQQRRDHLERWVFGRGADQREDPCSTAPSRESCCDLLKRWISSMNRKGGLASKKRCFWPLRLLRARLSRPT